MKLTMKTLYASPERSIQPGETADFSRDEAEQLLAGRYAVKAEDDPAETEPEQRPRRRRSGRRATGSGETATSAEDTSEQQTAEE